MSKNPFPTVPDPADEPPFEPDPPADNHTSPGKPGDVLATGEVGISFKFGTGYEAPMLHFKASSLEALADLTGYDRTGESGPDLFFGLTEYAANASKFVTGKYTEITGRKLGEARGGNSGGGSSGGARKGTPPEANKPPAWMGEAPTCKGHDLPTKYVSRTKADGTRWHAWGCPLDKDESCGLDFRNAPKG